MLESAVCSNDDDSCEWGCGECHGSGSLVDVAAAIFGGDCCFNFLKTHGFGMAADTAAAAGNVRGWVWTTPAALYVHGAAGVTRGNCALS